VLVVIIAGLALAGEFLGLVPDTRPEDLAPAYKVVGVFGDGVLVRGSSAMAADLAARGGTVLAAETRGLRYFTVRLFAGAQRADLENLGRILDFDGEQYVVEVTEDAVERLIALPVMVGRVAENGWVFKSVPDRLPPVVANPLIEQLVARVSADSVLGFVRRLQEYRSRYSTGDSCRVACDWVAQKFRDYGCDTVILMPHRTGHAPNVIGIRYGAAGQRNPYAIISGHIDSYAASNAPGADDNASGTVAALEACRVTQGALFTNDLKFIAWTGEEFGLYGSDAYADAARARGDSILGVLNFDMIGYVDAAPEDCDMMAKIANPPCEPFCDWFIAVADTYTTLPCNKQMMSDNQNSDHGPFWSNGYVALTGIEDFWPGNPHYHTSHDSIGAGYNNNDFCTNVIRAGVAALATLGQPVPLNQPLVGVLRTRLDDASGNGNGRWDPGEAVDLYATLKNYGLVGAHAVSVTLSESDPYVTVQNDSVWFGDIAGNDTAAPAAPFAMTADPGTPREHRVDLTLTIAAAETTWTTNLALEVGQLTVWDPIPDNYPSNPHFYAFDDVDSGYTQRPTYNWVEINGVGTRLTLSDDQTVQVTLPPAFGAWKYYGQRYTNISVCSNGWISPGSTTNSSYSNVRLPDNATPANVAVYWEDLYPGVGNGVWYWHDAANQRFIIEWDSVAEYTPRSSFIKAQIVIHDTTVQSVSGENLVVFQYHSGNDYSSCTIGIENPTAQYGLSALVDGAYHRACAPFTPGRAIAFDGPPTTAVAEPTRPTARSSRLTATHVRGVLNLPASSFGIRHSTLVDATGRKVLDLRPGANDISRLAPGVYFVRAETPAGRITAKTLILN
jgi:hypothetical protein